jgi:Ca-activated chloride channel family protein
MSDFHFIRPFWLLALIPSLWLVVILSRQRDAQRIWRGIIADHLLTHLVSDTSGHKGLQPSILLGAVLILASFSLAGPTWQHEPAPFADDTASLVIAVKVTASMQAQDIQPSRLERASQKIKDLLDRRKGSKTALVAYAGSAHLVMPLTEDSDLIAGFAAELDPKIMPVGGDAADQALELAQAQLTTSGLAGSVLLVTDYVAPAVIERIRKVQAADGPRVHIYGIAAGPEAFVPPGSPPAPPLDRVNLKQAAAAGKGSLVIATPDGSDIDQLTRIVETQFSVAGSQEGGERWRDSGYWLVPLIALLALWWFRPGWTIQWRLNSIHLILIPLLVLGSPAYFFGDGSDDNQQRDRVRERFWFQTTNQKAQRLFDNGNYAKAAAMFSDPARQGTAWYRAGDFGKAAAAYGRSGTPEGMFNRGNALLLTGEYPGAIQSYEQALNERPVWKEANENRDLAKARLQKLAPPDDAVSQKSVGEDDEPDEIVFDDRAKDLDDANTETVAGAGEEMSDKALRAMWLRRVETSPADFLRRKFSYQYERRNALKATK